MWSLTHWFASSSLRTKQIWRSRVLWINDTMIRARTDTTVDNVLLASMVWLEHFSWIWKNCGLTNNGNFHPRCYWMWTIQTISNELLYGSKFKSMRAEKNGIFLDFIIRSWMLLVHRNFFLFLGLPCLSYKCTKNPEIFRCKQTNQIICIWMVPERITFRFTLDLKSGKITKFLLFLP